METSPPSLAKKCNIDIDNKSHYILGLEMFYDLLMFMIMSNFVRKCDKNLLSSKNFIYIYIDT